jgi:hypothetical protein
MARRSQEENARLDRLAGSGKGWGGGLPLPLLFAAILNELLDNETASQERLTEIAADVLAFKSNQVMSVWPSWEAFTADVLAQMASKDIVQGAGGMWYRGEALIPGSYIEVIPARAWQGHKYPHDGVTVWEKDEREFRSRAAHSEREATSLVGNFRPAAPDHVSEIRQSVEQVGRLYPVLVDQHGRILDGGHRKAADPNWPERRMTVRSEQEALAIGLWANRGQPLTRKQQARVTELIGELAGTSQLKRERAKDALVADPSRSNRDIAREIGCSHNTVNEVRQELQETGQIDQFTASGGRGVTTGIPAPAAPRGPIGDIPGARAEVQRRMQAGQPVRRQEVAQQYGVSEITVRAAAAEAQAALDENAIDTDTHDHIWGPWIRARNCVECGEQELEEG